jgi:glycogen debranching enzyme
MGIPATAPAPPAPHEQAQRKQQVLTRHTPSVARAIADAVVLKDGDLFFLSLRDGRVPPGREHGFGLYYHDCRFLDTYDLRLGDDYPEALGCTAAAGRHATFELTTGNLEGDGDGVGKEQLGLTWDRTLDGAALTLMDRITLTNWGRDPADATLELRFDGCFDDVFQVRGLLPQQFGTRDPPAWRDGELRFEYHGADDVDRIFSVSFSDGLRPAGDNAAAIGLSLRPRERRTLSVRVTLQERPRAGAAIMPAHGQASPESLHRYTEARSDSVLLDRLLTRSLLDLELLRSEIEGDDFFAAGVPWFATLFGRDALISALQVLAFEPGIAASTLRLLARHQADRDDRWRDAEPGKILHELRVGELARVGAIPHSPYYGTVDATPLFLVLLARHAEWTGDLALFHELRTHVDRALEWIGHAAAGTGYVAYHSSSEHGLINQGWKDSGNAIVDQHGHLATPPVALVEVQAYVYQAKLAIADLCRRTGETALADTLRAQAEELKTRFNRDFWLERLGCYALALENGGQPLEVVASNAGHALWGGIADLEKARRTADRLMQGDMFSGWGVRTLSTEHPAFNPVGYHLGTVWPHDNALIAAGCRRYEIDQPAHRIFEGITAAATHFAHDRLPELFAGFARDDYGEPIRYPVACHPQAWAAGSVPYLLQALLGLEADGFEQRLRVVRPSLPDFVDWLELRGIRVGSARIDLRFRRTSEGAAVERLATEGELDLVVEQ